jgi:peptidoglycan pentaglycine glycine transferase (the first glycine)
LSMSQYHVEWSEEVENPQWDQFVAGHPGGDHVQTNLWARLKNTQGWKATRLIVYDGERIAAGAQMLYRRTTMGCFGYVVKGPLFADENLGLTELVMAELREAQREHRIHFLAVQPAITDTQMEARLIDWEYDASPIEVASTATLCLDLTPSTDDLLAAMRRETRYGIRRSAREGITVRMGTRGDLPIFLDLLGYTGERQGFSTYPLDYYQQMWDLFAPPGYLQLFIAEYEDEPVSAATVIAFGSTVIGKQRGWSGQHSKRRPNEGLDWAMIQWAKAQGYRSFDLGGVNREAARLLLADAPLPDEYKQGPLTYKLGFHGDIALYPRCYARLANPFLQSITRLATQHMASTPLVKRFVSQMRTN